MRSVLEHVGAIAILALGVAFMSFAPGPWWVDSLVYLVVLAIVLAILGRRR